MSLKDFNLGINSKVSANVSWEGLLVDGKGRGWWNAGDVFRGRLLEFRILYAKASCHERYSQAGEWERACMTVWNSWMSAGKAKVKI